MFESSLKNKIIFFVRNKVLALCAQIKLPYLPYRSYWHFKITPPNLYNVDNLYLSAMPNRGAGIGHQMANWIAGYWFSKLFGLRFAHIPFATNRWDFFLGFGEDEVSVNSLIEQGYSIRRIPRFDEDNIEQVSLIKKILASYQGKKIVFIAEQDQFYHDQYGVIDDLKQKFYSASVRKADKLIYSPENFNIAIHVRRGDIMTDPSNPNLTMRYLSNDYFYKVLNQVVKTIRSEKPIHIYFFSQGTPEDYPEFHNFENIHWCMEMGAQDSFLHMVRADLLITSKSSFSYKPALINEGIKVCPRNFWHGYPDSADWIMVENDGTIKTEEIIKLSL